MDFKDDILASDPAPAPPNTEKEGDEEIANVRYEEDHRQLDDITHGDYDIPLPKDTGIKAWLRKEYESSRGFELGTFDASLLPIVWKKQSVNWNALALGYISDVVSIVHDFIDKLLAKLCPDTRVLRELQSVLSEKLMERYKRGIDHTKWLLSVERSGMPLTANHYFADNLEKW